MMSDKLLSSMRLLGLLASLAVMAVGCGKKEGTKVIASGESNSTVVTSDSIGSTSGATGSDAETVPVTSPDAEIVRTTAEDLPVEKPKSDGPELVSFDDLKLGMPVDTKFRPRMLEVNDGRVKQLFGKRIIVAGYMDPTDTMKGVKEFILLRNLECKFGPGGQADHLVRIYLSEKETTSFTDKIVYVEGELALNPYPADPQNPLTYSIYDMVESKVSSRRPSR